jgi:aquaporin Z
MKRYGMEFIGAFFVALAVAVTGGKNGGAQTPAAVAGMLLGMGYGGRVLSGGHFNPAITIAALIRNKIDRTDALYYIMAQTFGGAIAALIGVFLLGCKSAADIGVRADQVLCAGVAEFFGAFALTFVFLNVYQTRNTEGGTAFGALAVAAVYFGAACALGDFSAMLFNPAAGLCAAIAGLVEQKDFLIYAACPVLGAVAAAAANQALES